MKLYRNVHSATIGYHQTKERILPRSRLVGNEFIEITYKKECERGVTGVGVTLGQLQHG